MQNIYILPERGGGEKDQISSEEEDWEGRRGVWGRATGSKSSKRGPGGKGGGGGA